MLIRSQDKKCIVNLETSLGLSIYLRISNEKYHILSNSTTDGRAVYIAEYSTEEKAIKVLDMIQNAYQYAVECKYISIGTEQPKFVFQMPTDSEVEV